MVRLHSSSVWSMDNTGTYSTPQYEDEKRFITVIPRGDTVLKNHASFYCTVKEKGAWCATYFTDKAVVLLRIA